MKKVIDHFKKLIDCEQFVITGTYALRELRLCKKVNDLDIILVNPSEDSISILDKLKTAKVDTGYPENKNQLSVYFNDTRIDFFILKSSIDVIELKDGLTISTPNNIAKAKRHYNRLKDIIQLQEISEIFFKKSDLKAFILSEKSKYLSNTKTEPTQRKK